MFSILGTRAKKTPPMKDGETCNIKKLLRPSLVSGTIQGKRRGQCTGTKEGYGWLSFQQVT